MAQKILLRRGPIANLAGAASSQGELLLATGVISDLTGPFLTMTGTSGTGTSTIVGKIYEGATAPAITTNSPLTGLPFYESSTNTLVRLNHAGNQALDLTGNLEGNAVSSMTISQLVGNVAIVSDGALQLGDLSVANNLTVGGAISTSGDLTAVNLTLSGNADIAGNITLGGNINIGDSATDTITLGGEITSNIIPDVDSTYDLGSTSKRWLNIFVDSITGDFISLTNGATIGTGLEVGGQSNFHGSVLLGDPANPGASVLQATQGMLLISSATSKVVISSTNSTVEVENTVFDGNDITVAGAISVAGGSTLTGTVALGSVVNEGVTATKILTLDSSGNVDFRTPSQVLTDIGGASGTVNLQAVTDNGSTTTNGISAASITTTADGSIGNDLTVTNDVTIGGNLTVSGTTTTVDSTTVAIGDNIIELNAAGTVADGGIIVRDTTAAADIYGSMLWNSTGDYWYAGVDGSTHYRLATFANATPATSSVPRVDADKRLVAGSISDTGALVTVSSKTVLSDAGGTDALATSAAVMFRNPSNEVGYVSTTVSSTAPTGVLGYNNSTGKLEFSNVIDGGTF